MNRALLKALIIPDTHRPYHHKKAYDLMLQVARDLFPDEIVILGDYSDCYWLSRYAKDPRVLGNLKEEVIDVNAGLDQIDSMFPIAKKVYIEGNHEARLEDYLINNAPALFGMTSIEHLFNINRRHNWKFVGYSPSQKYNVLDSKLTVKHTPIASNAKLTVQRAMTSIAYGHIHRIEEAYAVGINGEQHVAFSCGWLGDVRNNLIFDYVKNHHEWQLGFAIVYVDPVTKYFYHHIVPILNNMTCEFKGKIYRG